MNLADPRILAQVWSPLVGLDVPRISWDPVDGILHVIPVSSVKRFTVFHFITLSYSTVTSVEKAGIIALLYSSSHNAVLAHEPDYRKHITKSKK